MADDDKGKAKDLLDWLGVRALPDFTKARWIGAGVGILLTALFLLALSAAGVVLFHTIVQGTNPDTQGPNLGAGALIAALLGAPFLIWGTWLKYQTVRYQKEGHITDRINKAVEQLGAEKTIKIRSRDSERREITREETRPNIEVRMGAILSLERIAQDSTIHDNGRDHVRVMEILCAYVRENSIAQKPLEFSELNWETLKDEATDDERAAHLERRIERFGNSYSESKAWKWAKALPKPRVDVALALKVIGRRTMEQRRVEAAWPEAPHKMAKWLFDLPYPRIPFTQKEAELSISEIDALDIQRWDWQRQIDSYEGYRLDLHGANLQGASLFPQRLDASDAIFSGAILTNARLDGADLRRVRLEGAILENASLVGTALEEVQFMLANLSNAKMEAADLWCAQMEGASLSQARMEGSFISEAKLRDADLTNAQLAMANLAWVDMNSSTNLWSANMSGASVRKVAWSSVDISQSQLESMFGDASVILPPKFASSTPAHWPTWELPWAIEDVFGQQLAIWRREPKNYRPLQAPNDE